ncbi:phage integrase N-terminal SAM-like domain-containing protein [Laribacter hongkongensis]|uniref:phage integrase N-terminal SAM-like domain-containing protein n=1 Tax=Laribacter hongkongensis TaxID=168471 RepID=UPI0027E59D11|nr:phage integrase N-terminal SAM-like domain-containing protein [Laribacter hongkongensis]
MPPSTGADSDSAHPRYAKRVTLTDSLDANLRCGFLDALALECLDRSYLDYAFGIITQQLKAVSSQEEYERSHFLLLAKVFPVTRALLSVSNVQLAEEVRSRTGQEVFRYPPKSQDTEPYLKPRAPPHYSLRTEQQYVHWVRRFLRFHHYQHPREIGAAEVSSCPVPDD